MIFLPDSSGHRGARPLRVTILLVELYIIAIKRHSFACISTACSLVSAESCRRKCHFILFIFHFFALFLGSFNKVCILASESPEVPDLFHTPGLSFSIHHVFTISSAQIVPVPFVSLSYCHLLGLIQDKAGYMILHGPSNSHWLVTMRFDIIHQP